ncbi:MAG: hypothetical protein M3Q29_05675 [Chloroflexota bacterium]|nr:hypothetical protein [Chloroflexota bacterium]
MQTAILTVSGGGRWYALRNLLTDEQIQRENADIDVIQDGVLGCAVTQLTKRVAVYQLRSLAAVSHLPLSDFAPHER